jgi:hypothetical protein
MIFKYRRYPCQETWSGESAFVKDAERDNWAGGGYHDPFGVKRSPAGAAGQGRVRTSGPSAVMATVCSAWAARLPSPLRMVQPSSSM